MLLMFQASDAEASKNEIKVLKFELILYAKPD